MSKLICIDPGHGGSDTGATRDGVHEKDLALDISLKLDNILDYWNDFDTIMTRREDEYVGLSDRAKLANRYGAHIFVSVHINSFTSPYANGLETYHFPGSIRGKNLANITQRRLVKNINLSDRGVKTAKFTVLQRTSMSAILTELGFISNPETKSKLQKEYIQFLKAYSLADSIRSF